MYWYKHHYYEDTFIMYKKSLLIAVATIRKYMDRNLIWIGNLKQFIIGSDLDRGMATIRSVATIRDFTVPVHSINLILSDIDQC